MKPALFLTAMVSALASVCHGDIVLSVGPIQNMDQYMSVLSKAWDSLYPAFDTQLAIARQQVPAEYNYLLKLLDITGVPSTFDSAWASAFIGNAQKVGPTTILANAIPDASADPAVQPTQITTTNSNGEVATLTGVPTQYPTIVVAINGNVNRVAHAAQSSATGTGAGAAETGTAGTVSKKSGAASLATSTYGQVLAAALACAVSAAVYM
ncbi:hypothetical protein GGI12_000644 [Dipsacomyces acuminosporus]|nr:hypothetical protein GGI12_000644 [Dipsacomyces acuminosporus]